MQWVCKFNYFYDELTTDTPPSGNFQTKHCVCAIALKAFFFFKKRAAKKVDMH